MRIVKVGDHAWIAYDQEKRALVSIAAGMPEGYFLDIYAALRRRACLFTARGVDHAPAPLRQRARRIPWHRWARSSGRP
jgi:hypothetical protein